MRKGYTMRTHRKRNDTGRNRMSNKERIIRLLDGVPDSKLVFIVDMLENLRAYAGEAIPPDEWDQKMIDEAEAINDGTAVSIEDLSKELGIAL